MKRLTQFCRAFGRQILPVLAIGVLTIGSFRAMAEDRLTLKDGRVLTGEIVQETAAGVLFSAKYGGVSSTDFIRMDLIDTIERDIDGTGDTGGSDDGEADRRAEADRRSAARASEDSEAPEPGENGLPSAGAPRAAVVTLEGQVGVQFAAKALRDLIPMLEEDLGTDGTGILVLKINSGGGLGLEIEKLSDALENEFKPRFRVVAWIESAISAAAMTAHTLEEIYFMPEGNYGACTGYSGNLVGVQGVQLLQMLDQMRAISARGGHDPEIMHSMQVDDALGATIMPNGQVKWTHDSENSEHLVNPPGKILTFNSQQAERFGFSRGTAANLDELEDLMGLTEVEWVGEYVPGLLYPVTRAEKEMMEFRKLVTRDEERTNEYFTNYQLAISAARGASAESRGAFVGRARQHLNNIVQMVRRNPNFSLLIFGTDMGGFEDWVREQEDLLRELLRGGGGGGGGGLGTGGGAIGG